MKRYFLKIFIFMVLMCNLKSYSFDLQQYEKYRNQDFAIYVYSIPKKLFKQNSVNVYNIADFANTLPKNKTYTTVYIFDKKINLSELNNLHSNNLRPYSYTIPIEKKQPILIYFSNFTTKPKYYKSNFEILSVVNNGCISETFKRDYSTENKFIKSKTIGSALLQPCK